MTIGEALKKSEKAQLVGDFKHVWFAYDQTQCLKRYIDRGTYVEVVDVAPSRMLLESNDYVPYKFTPVVLS